MTPNDALPLQGTLGNSGLIDALRLASQQQTYCSIQVAGAPTSGEIHLANGQILIKGAADPNQRQQEINAVFAMLRASLSESGAFRLVPLSHSPNADSTPRMAVEAAIYSATTNPTTESAPPAAVPTQPVAAPTADQSPATAQAPSSAAPALDLAAEPVVTVQTPPATSTTQPERRIRASQLRKILRSGGSISEHLPTEPESTTAPGAEPNRNAALRELIGQLATN